MYSVRAGCFSSTSCRDAACEICRALHFSFLSYDDAQWHALGREEQAKYYELARRERQLHMQLYPDWSSRANTQRGKKRKRKQETTDGGIACHSVDTIHTSRPAPSVTISYSAILTLQQLQ